MILTAPPADVTLTNLSEYEDSPSETPWQLTWRQLRKNRFAMAGGIVLILLYSMAILGNFVSPYSITERSNLVYQPPSPIRFHNADGGFSLRPFTARLTLDMSTQTYHVAPGSAAPLHFFVHGESYRLLGLLPLSLHLFGTSGDVPFHPLGTDSDGRDVFSRLMVGSQISLRKVAEVSESVNARALPL